DIHECVAEQIEEDCSMGGSRVRGLVHSHAGDSGEGDEDIAGVGDGAVSKQSLYVALNESTEIAEEHGDGGDDPESPEPIVGSSRNCRKDAQKQGEGCGLGAGREKSGDRRWSAFINIGSPNLKRGCGNFEAEANEDESEADRKEAGVRLCDF